MSSSAPLLAYPLRPARVHEACGPGAISFAAMLAAQGNGPVLWLREAWRSETLNPDGLSTMLDPARLLLGQTRDQTDTLAVAEEALRDGAVPLVVIELGESLSLTAGRRLQLAAKAGHSTGLCLISEALGSNAAETRWRCTPAFSATSALDDSTTQLWELIKNKSGTDGAWHVRWDQSARHVAVVPPVGE